MIKLLLSNPGARDAIKQQMAAPTEMIDTLGDGLFAGREPQKGKNAKKPASSAA